MFLYNQDVLRRANLTGIEAMIIAAQLRWSGHVMRMHDNRIPKQIFCSELVAGKRRPGGQIKRYKDLSFSEYADDRSRATSSKTSRGCIHNSIDAQL